MWAFYWFLGQLVFPMIALGWVTNIFQRGAASMGRLNFILKAEPNIADAKAQIAESSDAGIRGQIEFRHLTFTYPTVSNGTAAANGAKKPAADEQKRPVGLPVLQDINLHIPAGSTLAIVGPTGSGKSTLAALVARLWEAPAGSLLLDGRSIRDYSACQLAKSDWLCAAGYFSFQRDGSREHCVWRRSEAIDEEVLEAAEIASISGEIEAFPQRFDTMVGERGVTLSGGQKQRTALARAVLRQPKILILDDSLSAVDTDTEERILGRLRDVMKQRTTSHRGASRLHGEKRGSNRGAARRTNHRARNARGTTRAGRLLRRPPPETTARGRIAAGMSDFREEEKLGKLYDSQLTRRLMKYLRPYVRGVVLAVSLSVVVTALEIAGPFLFHVAIDGYILPGCEWRKAPARGSDGADLGCRWLTWAPCLQASRCNTRRCGSCSGWGSKRCTTCGAKFSADLQRLPMSFFDRSPVGRLVTRATTDVDALNDLFASGVVAMLNDFLLPVRAGGILLLTGIRSSRWRRSRRCR